MISVIVVQDSMSLRKSPTLTPARLTANRRNAQKSTGPRTTRGKAWSRLNALKGGAYSQHFMQLMWALNGAPPGGTDAAADAILTPEQAAHPLFRQAVELAREADIQVAESYRRSTSREKWRAQKTHPTKP